MSENLVLTNYGVTLSRLTENEIEMVRNWRNAPKIQATMQYRDYITPEMQKAWFERINNAQNYYFVVEYKGEKIGLINVKDIDYTKKCGESGVFIYEDKYLATDIAYRAHLVLFDFIYEVVGLDYTYSHILPGNPKAYRFVEFLGAKRQKEQCTDSVLYYTLLAEDYLANNNRNRFIRKWNILSNKTTL